jgi:hypothetical protein
MEETMANYSDPQPVGYCKKTFRVNLETVNRQGHLVPNRTIVGSGESVAEADNQKTTRSTWLPDLLNNNHPLKHGDTFDVSGIRAYKLKSLYVTGSPDDLLILVSES